MAESEFSRLMNHIEETPAGEEVTIELPMRTWKVLERTAELAGVTLDQTVAVIVAIELIKRGAGGITSSADVSELVASQVPVPGSLASFLPESVFSASQPEDPPSQP